jgi:hypothetical protein
MSQQEQESLALDTVVRRFAESERTLAEVRERLQSLTNSAESANGSAASLRESSETVRSFALAATNAAEELRAATAEARGVLEQGAALLEGGALRAIEEQVGALSAATRESGEVMASDIAAARATADQLLSKLDALSARVHRLDRGAEIIFSTLPGRWRGKTDYPG